MNSSIVSRFTTKYSSREKNYQNIITKADAAGITIVHMHVKPGDKSKDLTNEIWKKFYSLYQAKELKKYIKSVQYRTKMDTMSMNKLHYQILISTMHGKT